MDNLTREQAIEKVSRNANNYKDLPKELRKDPEILRVAMMYWKPPKIRPLLYALPEALTRNNIFLAIDKGILTNRDLTKDMLSDREVVKYYIEKRAASIYVDIATELKKDPKILKLAIENWQDRWSSPTIYAQPEALTYENICLAIDRKVLSFEELTESMLADKQVMMYFIQHKSDRIYDKLSIDLKKDKDIVKCIIVNGFASVYKDLPAELKKDPEILKLAIENWEDRFSSPLSYAFPEGITNEIIDWLISNNIFPETDNFLNNKYYILQVAEKRPDILTEVSNELKKDKEIQLLSLIFNPQFLGIVECESIQQFLNNYGNKYNITNYSVKDVLKDSNFIKRVLLEAPQAYTLLPDEWQRDDKNIETILEVDGTNLIFVPHSWVTDDLVDLAKNSYGELFELLNDSSRILDFLDMIKYYDKIFAYVLYVFAEEWDLLDKFINHLKNSEEATKEMVKIIGNSRQLFANFLDTISSNQQARQFFSELLTKNNVLIPKKINNAKDLWSPVDLSFKKTYKFIRGVVGIDKSGFIIEMSLDNTRFSHSHATARIGIKTGCKIENIENHPFVLGKEVSRQGTLIIQIEGASMTTYLPENLSLEQYNSLMQVLELCKEMKTIGFTHKPNDLYADDPNLKIKITLQDLIDYCNKMLENQNELGKQNL